MAGASFVIVAPLFVSDGGITPVIHAHLQQCSARDADTCSDGASFEVTRRKCGAGRRAPEVPDTLEILADAEDDGGFCESERDGVVGVSAEPGVAGVKSSAECGVVVVEDGNFAVYPTRQLGMSDFDLGIFISGDPGVGNGDSPKHGRREVCGLGDGIDVSGLVADFIRDAGIGLGEGEERNKDQQDLANLAQRLPRGRWERF